jgi:regulator of sigma E protease
VLLYGFIGAPKTLVVVEKLSQTNPIAANAGLHKGDIIVGIDSTLVSSPDEVISYLAPKANTPVTFKIDRGGQDIEIPLTPNESGKVGASLITRQSREPAVADIATAPLKATITLNRMNEALFEMIKEAGRPIENSSGSSVGGDAAGGSGESGGSGGSGGNNSGASSAQGAAPRVETRVRGPAMMVALMEQVTRDDWRQLFMMFPMLSYDFGLISMLPLPGLDGGHIAALILSSVRKRPLAGTGIWRWLARLGMVSNLLGSIPLCMLRGRFLKK